MREAWKFKWSCDSSPGTGPGAWRARTLVAHFLKAEAQRLSRAPFPSLPLRPATIMKTMPSPQKPKMKQAAGGKLHWKRWFDCFFMDNFRTFLSLPQPFLLCHGNIV